MSTRKKKSESTPKKSTVAVQSPAAELPAIESSENPQPAILKVVGDGDAYVLSLLSSLLSFVAHSKPPYGQGVSRDRLALTDQELLAAASYTTPMKAREICEKAYHALPSGHTKGILSKLKKMGFLKLTSKGYIRLR